MSTVQITALATAAPGPVPAAVRVRVFHNNYAPSAFLRGYESGDTVTEVFTYSTQRTADTNDDVLAAEAYTLFNVGHDSEFGVPDPRAVDYRARRNRSLSVGDVLDIDGRFFACDAVGWRALPEAPPVEQIAASGTTPLY